MEREISYDILARVPLEGGHDLQMRIDSHQGSIPDHLNQDITGLPGKASNAFLADSHYRPLFEDKFRS
jgi:hypothetical protein